MLRGTGGDASKNMTPLKSQQSRSSTLGGGGKTYQNVTQILSSDERKQLFNTFMKEMNYSLALGGGSGATSSNV